MELLIPSLAFILLAVAIAFLVLPTFAPMILVSGSAVMLVIAMYLHVHKFGAMEYRASTWQDNLRKYTSYVLVAAILMGAYGFYAMNNSTSVQSIMPSAATAAIVTPPLPAITMPTVGGGLHTVARTVTSRMKDLMRHGRMEL